MPLKIWINSLRRIGGPLAASLFLASVGRSDAVQRGVVCLSRDPFPEPQCASNTAKVRLRSELGSGEDADFMNASNLIVSVDGPNEGGDLDKVYVTSQKRLAGDGRDKLTRENGSVSIIPAETPSPGLRQKNTVVIVKQGSGVPALDVDASSGAPGQNAGNVVVVADRLQSLSIKSSGYDGRSGEQAAELLALKALSRSPDVHPGIAADYKKRREEDLDLGLPFDDFDLNNYEASGLKCRADETPIGGPGSYAYDNATDPGSVPRGINITAYAREESKRAYCQRTPEFTVTQQCEAEKEYSFGVVCKVKTEGRSVKFFKRDPVRWTRPICATSTDNQVRRKIVRQAYVEISIPGVKSYQGLMTREISIATTHNIYKKAAPGAEIPWENPFWEQAQNIQSDATLQIAGAPNERTINNGYNDGASYPPRTVVGGPNKGVKLTFKPKSSTNGGANSLFSFRSDDFDFRTPNVGFGIGCGSVIDLGADPRYAGIKAEETSGYRVIADADFQKYVNYYKSFDSNSIGFTHSDLLMASVRVSNCIAYEVMDGIVQGEVVFGDWALASGNGEQTLIPPPPTSTSCADVPGFDNVVGSETFMQYEAEDSCYVDDPRQPPGWLKDIKCQAMGEAPGCAPRQSDFLVADLSSKYWNHTSATKDPISTAVGGVDTRHLEFKFPESVPNSEIQNLATADYKKFCVPVGDSLYSAANSTAMGKLTRAIAVPKFVMRQVDNVAVPTTEYKYICPSGIRLDNFLANTPRPTCPTGTSTLLKHSKWSALHGAGKWETWSMKGPLSMTPETNYSERAEFVETRYDDLPPRIFSARTHEVDSGVSIAPDKSFTGASFPSPYNFIDGTPMTKVDSGVTRRLYPGWTRESSLKNRLGSFVSADTFVPFDGSTFLDRATAWCNANAFENQGGSIARSFGAKGILRDTPKRVFGFTLEEFDPNTGNRVAEREYVGIEIVAEGNFGASQGFFGTGIYSETGGQKTVAAINQSLGSSAFFAKNYPFLGSRFQESCEPGELYNNFTGFCHSPGTAWRSARRVVSRVLHDGETREPWVIPMTKAKLTDPSTTYDLPFCVPPAACATRGANDVNIDANILDIYRLGFMRPLANMADNYVVPRDILMNRPENIDQMVLGPGFATAMGSDSSPVCTQQFRMIAVPVPTSQDTPVTVTTDDYLPEGSVFLAVDTECRDGVFGAKSTIRRLGANKTVEPSSISLSQTEHVVDPASGAISLVLRNGQPRRLFALKNIRESLNAGIAATTGAEELEVVEVLTPLTRDRTAEWPLSRNKGGKGWQNRITTAPTEPTQEQSTQPRACTPSSVAGGIWKTADATGPAILNSSTDPSVDCKSAAAACALDREEVTLFTKTVSNSRALSVTREAATQFTPWSHEVAPNAPKDTSYLSSKPLGQWTQVVGGQDGAPVPSCAIYDGTPGEGDRVLDRGSFDAMDKILDSPLYKIKKPGSQATDFIILPEDANVRRSESCTRWDAVNGQTCEVFQPTIGGQETGGLIFGGKWTTIYVETKERLAQTCREFAPGVGGIPTATCKSGSDAGGAPFRQPKGNPRVEFCSPNSCAFQTNSQSFQVEASIPISGRPGEDGTSSGSATVFCRDCRSISFTGRPGVGGAGSAPLSSRRSKTLTCASWNDNPLAPIFSVRNLWSQPFVGGTSGQNGRPGLTGGDVNVFSDLTPEAIFMMSDEPFWVPRRVSE